MKQINLSKNKVSLVNDNDFKELSKYKWTAKESGGHIFYAVRRNPIDGSHIYMHKQIMNFPACEVDHINGNPLDNRKQNLRLCTHRQNLCNQKLSRLNTSGYKGVSWNKSSKKWEAYIKVNQKRIHLGKFLDKEHAALEYDKAAIKYFGVFARLNLTDSPGK